MQRSVLTHTQLHREGSSSNGCTVAERLSSDFVINGESLLSLFASSGFLGHADFMGCFISGFPESNLENTNLLLLRQKPNLESGRIILYMCPECGDLGCGALTAFVSQNQDGYTWHGFAYENGYESPRECHDLGPYIFEMAQYEKAIVSASAP